VPEPRRTPPPAAEQRTPSGPPATHARHPGIAPLPPSYPPTVGSPPPSAAGSGTTQTGGDVASAPTPPRRSRRRWLLPATTILLALSTALLGGATAYLWHTSDAWEQRAADYESASKDLGAVLATTRADLKSRAADLVAVRAQLSTAQARIIELANEKAQIGDDREAQRLLVDYQQRVSKAAGTVAQALDQCVQGQNELIGDLQQAELFDPAYLATRDTQVQALCQAATDANIALQRELSR
jgi:hypothetical protein